MAPRPAMARTPPLSKPDVPVLRSAPLAVAHGPLYVAPGLPLGQRHPLVVLPLAATYSQLQLDAPLLLVQLQGNERHAGFPRLPGQVPDLAAVEQELPRPGRLVVVAVALIVGGDVRVVQPRLAPLDPGVPLPQLDLAGSDRLHFRAGQDQPGLHVFQDVVIVERLAVGRENLVRHRKLYTIRLGRAACARLQVADGGLELGILFSTVGRLCDHQVRIETLPLQRLAARRQPDRRRYPQARGIREGVDRLDRAFTVALLADQCRAPVVVQRRGDNLGRARATAVDQDDHRQPGRLAAGPGPQLLALTAGR